MWANNKKLDELSIGMKIDVRGIDYVWSVGTIKMLIESIKREPIMVIHYDGWNKHFDELIFKNSPRIA